MGRQRPQLRVRANADTPTDARTARSFGAEGIGLCRTEHMFFDDERILAVREMILADDADGRRAALAKILPLQREDFAGIFRAMDGLPVTIRLLDPPLHEFLPHERSEIDEVAADARRVRRAARARTKAQLARVQPDARPPRLPPRDHLSRRSTRCRSARSLEAACAVARRGRRGAARDHDPAGR